MLRLKVGVTVTEFTQFRSLSIRSRSTARAPYPNLDARAPLKESDVPTPFHNARGFCDSLQNPLIPQPSALR